MVVAFALQDPRFAAAAAERYLMSAPSVDSIVTYKRMNKSFVMLDKLYVLLKTITSDID